MSLVFICGGGTAGHINPGIAIAKALIEKKNIKVEFVGTKNGLETKLVPAQGFQLHLIFSAKFNTGRILDKIKAIFFVFFGFMQSLLIIKRLQPSYVLGVGGYASVPMVLAAGVMGVPCGIWEANAKPGLANKFLAKFVLDVFLVFSKSKIYFSNKNTFEFGILIRKEIESSQFPLQPGGKLKVLHYGGSQGSRFIGNVIFELLSTKAEWLKNLEIVHQTGKTDFENFKQKYAASKISCEVYEYLDDMVSYYQWADLVIARAGASTVAELAAVGRPAILVPLPIADGHQGENAIELAAKDAAIMIEQKDFNAQVLGQVLQEFLQNKTKLRLLGENIKKFHHAGAAEKIAEKILNGVRT